MELAALTTAEAWSSLQDAVFASLGIMTVALGMWHAFGKSIYRRVFGWFEKLDKRLDTIDEGQAAAITERESDRRAAEARNAKVVTQLEVLTGKFDGLHDMVQDHQSVLYGNSTRAGLIQDVSYMRGRDDERRHPLT